MYTNPSHRVFTHVASRTGYALVVAGSLLAFGGGLQMLRALDATNRLALWGIVALLGVFVLTRGILSVMTATEDGEDAVDPDEAVEKTDSRFGRR